MARFVDRESAGRELGHRLRGLYLAEPVVRAVSGGGVDVGRAVGRVLRAQVDILGDGRSPADPAVRPFRLDGRTVVLVTDGLVVEQAALSAVAQARTDGARRVVLAVPVGTAIALDRLSRYVDDLVALEVAGVSTDLSEWYEELPEVTEVTEDDVATVVLPVTVGRDERRRAPLRPLTAGRGQAGTAVVSIAGAANRSSRVPALRTTVRWPPR